MKLLAVMLAEICISAEHIKILVCQNKANIQKAHFLCLFTMIPAKFSQNVTGGFRFI